jgi:foldase protein PrsA
MSERTHSVPDVSSPLPARPKSKLVPVLAGTAVAVLIAGVAFQVFRAEEAVSQTRDNAPGQAPATVRVGNAAQPGTTLAKVNNQSISFDLVATEAVKKHGEEILDNLINRMIIQQECDRRGLSVTRDEVAQEVSGIARKFNLPTDTWYQMLQSERGIDKDSYHRDVIWPMLALKKLAGANITVTAEDMQRAFERDYGPRVEVLAIFVNGNIRHANDIWQKATADPENFDKVATQYSSDPNTRPLGGKVPPIRKHGGTPQIEQEAFRLKPGEISRVIEIDSGRFVILKCEGFTEQAVRSIDEVREELQQQLVEEKTQEAVAKVFQELKDKAQVINYLTQNSTAGAPSAGKPAGAAKVQQTSAAQPSGNSPVRPAAGAATK